MDERIRSNPERYMQRIRSRVTVTAMGYGSPCWISNRADNMGGYTKIGIFNVTYLVHRLAYELTYGDVPHGLVIDHLCRNRACCNPAHLEAVTHRTNLVRGDTFAASQVAQTHCRAGHPFTADNTYRRSDRTGRLCRTCGRENARRYRREKRLGLASEDRQCGIA